MVSDRDRGAVALLCLFAIVIAAAQFPAIGLGSAPDDGGPIGPPPSTDVAPSDGDAGDAERDAPDDGADATGTGTATETTTERTTRSTDTPTTEDDSGLFTDSRAGTDTATPTSKPTRTATATERSTPEPTTEQTTEAPGDAASDGGTDGSNGNPLATVGAVILIVAGALVVGFVAMAGGTTRAGDGNRDWSWGGRSRVGAKLLGYLPQFAASVTGAIGRLPRRTMGFVIGASRSTPRLFDALGTATGQLFTGLSFAGAGAARTVGALALQAPAGLAKGLGSLGRSAAGGLLSAPAGAGSLLGGLLSDETSSTDRPDADARAVTDVDPEEPSEPDLPPPPASVEEAWERMVEAAPVPDWQSKTPVEVARDAVRRGLPVEPVGRLTRLFRRVRYDPERPGDGALSGAREALARIERTERPDGGDTDE